MRNDETNMTGCTICGAPDGVCADPDRCESIAVREDKTK